MGSAHEGIGQRAGFLGCLPSGGANGASSAQPPEPTKRTGWKEEAAATTGCNVRKAAAPVSGAGPRSAAARGLPTASGSRAQELPKSRRSSLRAPAHPSSGSTLGESLGWLDPRCLGRCPACRLLSPPLAGSENRLNRGLNPDALVVPRPLPSPWLRPPPGQLPPPPPPRGGPSLA